VLAGREKKEKGKLLPELYLAESDMRQKRVSSESKKGGLQGSAEIICQGGYKKRSWEIPMKSLVERAPAEKPTVYQGSGSKRDRSGSFGEPHVVEAGKPIQS